MITHLESDILECEVKWALRSITTSKASGDDGIPVALFQILKYDAVEVLHSICQQIWKTQQWPQDWKRSVFIPIPKKGNASSVQLSSSVVSNPLWPHEPQHARPPCPSPTPGVYPNSCPLSRCCHPTISSSVVPFSFSLQSFPASGSLQVSQFFASGGQSIGVSASASVPTMNTQDWSPLGWTGWISLQSKWLSTVFSSTTIQNHQFSGAQLSSKSRSHIHTWLLEKP